MYDLNTSSNTIIVELGKTRFDSLTLGRVGENLAREIVFDCTNFAKMYGTGTTMVVAKLPSGVKYPVVVDQNGAMVSWKITAADVSVPGPGKVELRWIVNEVVAKTQLFNTLIRESLTGTDTDKPPDPYKDWVDSVIERSESAATSASADAEEASRLADEAKRSEELALSYKNSAAGSAQNAANSEQSASASMEAAEIAQRDVSAKHTQVSIDAANANRDAVSAQQSKNSAHISELNAKESEEKSSASEENSAESERKAKVSEISAGNSANAASISENNASESEQKAKLSEIAAENSKIIAVESSQTAVASKDVAIQARDTAIAARNEAVAAKTDSIAAKEIAVSTKNGILDVKAKLDSLSDFYLHESILDSEGNAILDSLAHELIGQIRFASGHDLEELNHSLVSVYLRLDILQGFVDRADTMEQYENTITELASKIDFLLEHSLLDKKFDPEVNNYG